MTKPSLIFAGAALAAALHAQTTPMASAFQQQDWLVTGSTMPGIRIEGRQFGPVVGKPFSATEVRRTVQTLNDGSHVTHTDTSRFYRDGQGRMRAESPDRVEIFDPVARVEYDLNPKDSTYLKKSISEGTNFMAVAVVGGTSWTSLSSDAQAESRQQSRRQGAAPVREDLAPQVLNGFNAKGTRVTTTIPKDTFGNDHDLKAVNEHWYSDDLQVLMKSSNSDPRFGVSTYELTDIVPGPPDPELFRVPAGYTQRQDHHRH